MSAGPLGISPEAMLAWIDAYEVQCDRLDGPSLFFPAVYYSEEVLAWLDDGRSARRHLALVRERREPRGGAGMARRRKPLVTVCVLGRDGEDRPMRLTKAQAFRAIQIEFDTQEAEEARAAGRELREHTQYLKDWQLTYLLDGFMDYGDTLLRPESVRQALAEGGQ